MPTRRAFLRSLSSATAGIFFVGCNCVVSAFGSFWGSSSPWEPSAAQTGLARKRREVMVGGHRVLTVDVHCHVAVPEVWDLIKDRIRREGSTGDLSWGPIILHCGIAIPSMGFFPCRD